MTHAGLEHRAGSAPRIERLRPDPELFTRVGGREVVGRIVDGLYDRIHDDPVLRPMFRRDAALERSNQKKFFEEWFGGESLYSQHVASVGLRLRHGHARIAPRDAARWLSFFCDAMDGARVPAAERREILTVLAPLAKAFVNDQDPVGDPDPDRHRCAKDHPRHAAGRAAARGDVAAVRAAIEQHPRLLGASVWGHPTLLYLAASRGRLEVIRVLVEAGADANQPCHEGYGPGLETPLCSALRKKKPRAAALLRELGARDDILTAATVGDVAAVAAYVETDPTLAHATDPADDFFGLTPLHHAVAAGHGDVARVLLDRGARVGDRSHLLVRAAVEAGDRGLLQLLLAHGADATRVGAGRWVLDANLSRLLVPHGADVTYESDPWASWIWQSCTGNHAQKDDPELVRGLLAHGADANAIHPYWRRSALHFAAKAGFSESLAALLDAGGDPNLPDAKDAETPLFHACKAGKSVDPRPVIMALLRAGADPGVTDRRGRSVLQAYPKRRATLAECGITP